MSIVPNQFPTLSAKYRIALVGEAPGKDEEASGLPFVGASGRLLNALLSRASIMREACLIANVCQHKPDYNVIANFNWEDDEIQRGISQLFADLTKFRPHLVVCLGATALHVLKEGNRPLKKRRDKDGWKFVYPNSIDAWRGSLFLSSDSHSLFPITKCIAAHHPAFCLRAYENTPLLMMDLNRAAKQGTFPELVLPQRRLDIGVQAPIELANGETVIINTGVNPDIVLTRIEAIRATRLPISLDIEGYYTGMSCISIATSAWESFIIPFARLEGGSYWELEDELRITRALAGLLADPRVPKCWQNGLYDRWVLQYGFSMPVFGNVDDTMLKWWEKYCELPKGLATQASILTEEPYYKQEKKSLDNSIHYTYCCRDSAVTYELNTKLSALLTPQANAHYQFNHALLNLFLYIELRGILYNRILARERLDEVTRHIHSLQAQLDKKAGCGLDRNLSPTELNTLVRSICCHKRDQNKPLKDYEDSFDKILKTLAKDVLSDDDYGYLAVELGLSMNIKGAKFKKYLYDPAKSDVAEAIGDEGPFGLGLPEQFSKTTGAVTTDFLALQKLRKDHPHPVLDLAIEIGILRTRAQMLEISADPDGRIRCGYNAVGTVSGRITCYTSPTGSGANLQTTPDSDTSKPENHPLRRGMRDLVMPDSGHWFFNADLRGSDGWTIGAHLNALGDSTMLSDLRAGIKPAARIAYMLRHGNQSLKGKSREEIKELLKEVKKDDWDYFACKVGIWGLCYLMGPDLLSDQIFEESDGRVSLSRSQVGDFHKAVFDGYGVKLWHDWMARQLNKKPELTSASGNTRRFFGRPQEILGEALSTEPQNNTTYATNLAALRLWRDPDNRISDKLVYDSRGNAKRIPFRIEPLHQMHDSLNGQFLREETEWAVKRICEYFNNTLLIAGQEIVIPFSGTYGPSWGEQIHEMN